MVKPREVRHQYWCTTQYRTRLTDRPGMFHRYRFICWSGIGVCRRCIPMFLGCMSQIWIIDGVSRCSLVACPRKGQATGLDAWASRVKCPARFVSHLHDICIYIWVLHSFCLFCCLFIIVTTQFVALYEPCKPKPKPKPSTYDTRTTTPWQRSKFRYLDRSQSNKYAINMQIQTISVSK